MAAKHPSGDGPNFEPDRDFDKCRSLIGDILRDYRVQLGEGWVPITFGEFAALLSIPLKPLGRTITPGEVYAWELGRSLPPDRDLQVLRLFSKPNSWQWLLAGDLRAAKYPQIHRASSKIARALLDQVRPLSRKMPTPTFRFRHPRNRGQGGGGSGTALPPNP